MRYRFVLALTSGLVLGLGVILPLQRASAAPPLRLPWPAGQQHRISGGNTYNCDTHNLSTASNSTAYNADYYAIDFQFGPVDGSPLYVSAVSAGTVVLRENDNDGYGNKVVLGHGGGYFSVYAHFQDGNTWGPGIVPGARVAEGQLLGYAGGTGQDPPYPVHLHMHMMLNLNAYRPEPMSGVRGFDGYGACVGPVSQYWISRHPYDVQKLTNSSSAFGGSNKDDAIVFFQDTGTWFVAPSSGTSFSTPGAWIGGHGIGSNRQLAADVNVSGGLTDSVVYFAGAGSWYVSLSTGSTFLSPSLWIQGHGIGSTNQFLQDVNQDGRADAVVFFPDNGLWYVALSTGSGFGTPSLWTSGHGVGSNDQLLADVTGDLRADAIVYFESTGQWFVAPSTGSSFGPYTSWIAGHGVGSDRHLVADVNADLKQDSVVYFGDTGSWFVALSTGSSFGAWSLWRSGHGIGSDNQMLSDASGDNRADAAVYFGQAGQGNWYVGLAPPSGSGFGAPSLWRAGYGIGS